MRQQVHGAEEQEGERHRPEQSANREKYEPTPRLGELLRDLDLGQANFGSNDLLKVSDNVLQQRGDGSLDHCEDHKTLTPHRAAGEEADDGRTKQCLSRVRLDEVFHLRHHVFDFMLSEVLGRRHQEENQPSNEFPTLRCPTCSLPIHGLIPPHPWRAGHSASPDPACDSPHPRPHPC